MSCRCLCRCVHFQVTQHPHTGDLVPEFQGTSHWPPWNTSKSSKTLKSTCFRTFIHTELGGSLAVAWPSPCSHRALAGSGKAGELALIWEILISLLQKLGMLALQKMLLTILLTRLMAKWNKFVGISQHFISGLSESTWGRQEELCWVFCRALFSFLCSYFYMILYPLPEADRGITNAVV